jgi:hypothetical protein
MIPSGSIQTRSVPTSSGAASRTANKSDPRPKGRISLLNDEPARPRSISTHDARKAPLRWRSDDASMSTPWSQLSPSYSCGEHLPRHWAHVHTRYHYCQGLICEARDCPPGSKELRMHSVRSKPTVRRRADRPISFARCSRDVAEIGDTAANTLLVMAAGATPDHRAIEDRNQNGAGKPLQELAIPSRLPKLSQSVAATRAF